MPIRPENRARYPKDWPAISASIRERAAHRCEHEDDELGRCSARQYAVGHWERRRNVFTRRECWCWRPTCGNGPHGCAGQGLHWPGLQRFTFAEARDFAAACNDDDAWSEAPRLIVIVLTVAHLDHNPENCDPENLRAWCQRHHLAYDHEHHLASAHATRRARSGTLELF